MNGASNGGYCGRSECPMSIGGVCGEGQTLEIIHEFKQLYQGKMKQIEDAAEKDYLGGQQAKISLQQDWIRDLTEQNEMLVAAVEELEMEATDRVAMLEEKLRNSANVGSNVMQKYRDFNFSINLDETFQKLVYLQNDVRNLLEFIRRARDEGTWSIEGLQFYDVTKEDLFGGQTYARSSSEDAPTGDAQVSNEIHMRDTRIRELETLLNEKIEELNSSKKSMLDMRSALTVEVADKHDVIVNLRRDVQHLEEQYRQSTKQTQFKDDIIKEMRKDIKLLKGQLVPPEKPQSPPPSPLAVSPDDSFPTFHQCCPFVEDLCPVNVGNRIRVARSKRSRWTQELASNYSCLRGEQFPTTNEARPSKPGKPRKNSALIFLKEEGPTRDCPPEASHLQSAYANYSENRSKSTSPRIQKRLTNERSTSTRDTMARFVRPQPANRLSISNILHEHYTMSNQGPYGSVDNYKEPTKPTTTIFTKPEKNVKKEIHSRGGVKKDNKQVPDAP